MNKRIPAAGLDPWAFSPGTCSVGTHVCIPELPLKTWMAGTSPAKGHLRLQTDREASP
jgi:hypothetical protein